MKDLLEELLGRTVEVRSQSDGANSRDDGKLVAYDERWIKIQKSYGEVLFFPIANVRLLKPLK